MKLTTILLSIIILVACQTDLDYSTPVSSENVPIAGSAIPVDMLTSDAILPIPTETPSFATHCVTFESNSSSEFLSGGQIVFWSDPETDMKGLQLVASGDGQIYLISRETGVSSTTVAPERQWLTYYDWKNGNQLKIVNSLTEEPIIRPWKAEWRNGLGLHWFDDQWLSVPSAHQSSGSLTLYNPFTDEEKRITPNLPNLYDFQESLVWGDFTVYNKLLSHVLYIGVTREEGNMLILRNLEERQNIWQISHLNAFRFPVKWTPDGTRLAIAGEMDHLDDDNFEIFLVDLEGNSVQATNLDHTYTTATINELSWSPNGRYLAFWLQERISFEDTTSFRLHILDTETGKTIDTCLPGGVGGPLIWSPDSQQLALEYGEWMKPNALVVLDINSFQAIQVIEPMNLILIGWTNWMAP